MSHLSSVHPQQSHVIHLVIPHVRMGDFTLATVVLETTATDASEMDTHLL